MKFLICSGASNDDTRDHLEDLYNTKSLIDKGLYNRLHDKIGLPGMKIKHYDEWVEK